MSRKFYAAVLMSAIAAFGAPKILFAQQSNPPTAAGGPNPATAPAQQLQLKPLFDTEGGTIITGLSGIVSATQQPLANGYLSLNRTMLFRTAFDAAVMTELEKTQRGTITPFANDATQLSSPTSSGVLCGPRGQYEVLAAQATYLNAVANTLGKLETNVQSKSIIEAITTLASSRNAIKIPEETLGADQAVIAACQTDLDSAWTTFFYPLPPPPAHNNQLSATLTGLDFSPLTEVTALLNVATQLIDFASDLNRIENIDNYLWANQGNLMKAASNLVAAETTLVSSTKNYTIGQFVEKMTVLATLSIDLSKIDACKTMSFSVPATGHDAVTTANGNAFLICTGKAWQQASDAVQAAVNAAAQYDSLSGVGSASDNNNLKKAVANLTKDFAVLTQPETFDLNNLLNDVSVILSYAQQVQKAISPASNASGKSSGNP